MIDEPPLVRQAQRGDHAAFGALYDQYAPLVRAIAYDASGDVMASHDIAQDVFLKAYCRLNQLRNVDRFGAWLTQIARRTSRDWQRSRRRDRHELARSRPNSPTRTTTMRRSSCSKRFAACHTGSVLLSTFFISMNNRPTSRGEL
jgi:RNA polymerase sigma factor (sigma-70 family)